MLLATLIALTLSAVPHISGGVERLPDAPPREVVECSPRGGMPNVLARLKAGKETRIAYLGGSITAQDGWRPKTLAWFQSQYPSAKITEINAAIGGTGSDLGVYRLRHDVLEFKPDLLFVEFAVNDSGAPPERIHKAMEGIVRQTWRADPNTDICFVYTLTEEMLGTLQSGKYPRAASAMEEVADHYAIPSIHMGLEPARLQQAGKLIFRGPLPGTEAEKAAGGGKIVFSGDGVHPYPQTGHQLYLEAVIRSMTPIRLAGTPGRHLLGAPLDRDNWEQAKMIPLSAVHLSSGWQRLDLATHPVAKYFQSRVPELWKADRAGETVQFRFRGTSAFVYDLLGPDCGQVSVQVDGAAPIVRPRFDAFSDYHRLGTLGVADSVPAGIHTVTITVLPDQPDKLGILHQRKENESTKVLDPAKYSGTAWYAGAILIIGDLVK